jgi:hypothetical protein
VTDIVGVDVEVREGVGVTVNVVDADGVKVTVGVFVPVGKPLTSL